MSKTGKVFLVGAGPGDKELLTLKGKRLIENAQVVVYDRLIGKGIMDMISESATKIDVGKTVGNHPVPQEEINQILLEKAKEGHDVIRLKGGDGFLFGRGGEELELLSENNIDFEVVPGITAAIGAATYGGIPVTHRDFCSSLHIITGHKQKSGALELDYAALVRLKGTLVFMMSVANMGEIARGLIENGMPSTMECAVIENGTNPQQRKFLDSIGAIEKVIKDNQVKSPALIVVGKVCGLSDKFDWFSNLPLKGKRILVTRPRETSSKLSTKLHQLGADVSQIPTTKVIPLDFTMPNINDYTMLIFTSAIGVRAFFEKLLAEGKDARALYKKRVAVVGKETARVLLTYGVSADFVPSIFSGEALAKEMISQKIVQKEENLFILRAKEASEDLTDILEENEISFDQVIVYETQYQKNEDFKPSEYDMITFTSGSCVDGFVNSVSESSDLTTVKAVCIGEQTAKEASKYGMNITIAKNATIEAMIECIRRNV